MELECPFNNNKNIHMDTATSVKVNICILFAKHCNSVNFRIMSRIQGGNRAGATIGRIVLPRYLGQILRARGAAGFRWDWEGGRLSPSYFRTLPPLDSPRTSLHCPTRSVG